MTQKYILVDHEVVPWDDLLDWAAWMEQAERIVKKSYVETASGDVEVSTVFLGLDHNWARFWSDGSEAGSPITFETLVFGGEHDRYMRRYATWDEAENGHDEIVKMVEDSKKMNPP